jgi:predicted dehydrogenase
MQPKINNKIRVAFYGGGYLSAVGRAHLAAISLDQRYELVAGCFSRDLTVNRETACYYQVDGERVYDDLPNLLENEKGQIDALILLTPSDQHFLQLMQCFDFGIPVICEKSLVTCIEDAELIVRRVQKENHFLAVTFNYTGYPLLRELKNIIKLNLLGEIKQVNLEMPQDTYLRLTKEGGVTMPQLWRQKDYGLPTVSLDLGVHIHSILKFLIEDSLESVVSIYGSYGNVPGIIDTVQSMARLSRGGHVSIWFGKTALGYRNGLKVMILGTKGAAEWLQERPEELIVVDSFGNKQIIDRASNSLCIANQFRYSRFKAGHPSGFIEAFANYYYDIALILEDYLSNKSVSYSPYFFGGIEALEGLKFLDAIDQSSKKNSWVDLN